MRERNTERKKYWEKEILMERKMERKIDRKIERKKERKKEIWRKSQEGDLSEERREEAKTKKIKVWG